MAKFLITKKLEVKGKLWGYKIRNVDSGEMIDCSIDQIYFRIGRGDITNCKCELTTNSKGIVVPKIVGTQESISNLQGEEAKGKVVVKEVVEPEYKMVGRIADGKSRVGYELEHLKTKNVSKLNKVDTYKLASAKKILNVVVRKNGDSYLLRGINGFDIDKETRLINIADGKSGSKTNGKVERNTPKQDKVEKVVEKPVEKSKENIDKMTVMLNEIEKELVGDGFKAKHATKAQGCFKFTVMKVVKDGHDEAKINFSEHTTGVVSVKIDGEKVAGGTLEDASLKDTIVEVIRSKFVEDVEEEAVVEEVIEADTDGEGLDAFAGDEVVEGDGLDVFAGDEVEESGLDAFDGAEVDVDSDSEGGKLEVPEKTGSILDTIEELNLEEYGINLDD